jgi:hypothetical protein
LLDYSLSLLTSALLELRVRGLMLLGDVCELVDKREWLRDPSYAAYAAGCTEWLTQTLLVEWLEKNKVLSLIFERDTHEELVRHSRRILVTLCKAHRITSLHIDLLWNVVLTGAESMSAEVRKVLIDLLRERSALTTEHAVHLLSRIQQQAPAEITAASLTLLRELILSFTSLADRAKAMLMAIITDGSGASP